MALVERELKMLMRSIVVLVLLSGACRVQAQLGKQLVLAQLVLIVLQWSDQRPQASHGADQRPRDSHSAAVRGPRLATAAVPG